MPAPAWRRSVPRGRPCTLAEARCDAARLCWAQRRLAAAMPLPLPRVRPPAPPPAAAAALQVRLRRSIGMKKDDYYLDKKHIT